MHQVEMVQETNGNEYIGQESAERYRVKKEMERGKGISTERIEENKKIKAFAIQLQWLSNLTRRDERLVSRKRNYILKKPACHSIHHRQTSHLQDPKGKRQEDQHIPFLP